MSGVTILNLQVVVYKYLCFLQITGSDEENYPLTRKVQRDIWVHQHPPNCWDPNVRFLVADWERLPGFGIGAQIAGMCGLLAIAINEKRVLVTNYYNRADHDGCKGKIGENHEFSISNSSVTTLSYSLHCQIILKWTYFSRFFKI